MRKLGTLHLLGQAVDVAAETVIYSPPAGDPLRVVPASRERGSRVSTLL
ncbi:MAG: hypothetical protein ACRDSR_18780 [Pseudonocardiaceae bacterium]